MMTRAETEFREAFERLKSGTPIILDAGSVVSQNNVAREAGRDPSALRKSRYPELIRDIQHWVKPVDTQESKSDVANDQSPKKKALGADVMLQLSELRRERDSLASQLIEADTRILELMEELRELRKDALEPPSNVTRLHPTTAG